MVDENFKPVFSPEQCNKFIIPANLNQNNPIEAVNPKENSIRSAQS